MTSDRKAHVQIDHILIDRRRHSRVLDVRSFREAPSGGDKNWGEIAVNKQRSHRSYGDTQSQEVK
jgi:hypothetical protein